MCEVARHVLDVQDALSRGEATFEAAMLLRDAAKFTPRFRRAIREYKVSIVARAVGLDP